ncbi:hypothetical protein ACGP04_04075 [Piscirickettsia salmonis]|uniref:hypothetical protein n=1 Tax=Piscirickettsia salmonis TaxID=1238 RepID=UPI000F08616D|nr:hypothetical protein DA717_08380 [Piscirickettsiaceae bacterium NZ-RLO2]
MGKELFSVSTDKVAEGALATSVAVAGVMYVKHKMNQMTQEEANKILEIFKDTLGTVDFPKPFNLDHEDGEVRIPKELQEYTLEQVEHGNPYQRELYKVGHYLTEYSDQRKKTGDPIHSVLCYLHYILLSPSGLMGLTGKGDNDFKKLSMFAQFLERFAQMPGANVRSGYVSLILDIIPTNKEEREALQALKRRDQDQDQKISKNAYTALQGIADSVNAEADFSRLEELSRGFADSTLRLATMGVTSHKIHSPLANALLGNMAKGTISPKIEKKRSLSWDQPAILLPTDDKLGFIPTIQQVAASLEDFSNQSDSLFQLTDSQLKDLIATSNFKDTNFNVTQYFRKTDGGTGKKKLLEPEQLDVARGYVAMLQLAQISADIARLAHYMNVHIRTESASSATPFAFSTSDTTTAVRTRCYETMALLKKEADDIYQKNALPLIGRLAEARGYDGTKNPQAAYALSGKLTGFKKDLEKAYEEIQKYKDPKHFKVLRDQSDASIQKLEQEVSAVAQKYNIGEEKLTKLPFVPDRDYKEINTELTAHVASLSRYFSSEEFIRLAQGVFGGLVSCKGKQVTFDIQSDADLIRLEALAKAFTEQLETTSKTYGATPSSAAMLGSVSGPDLAFGYMPSQGSEDPQALDKRLQKRKKGFKKSIQRYAAEAKPREETKVAATAAQEKIARLEKELREVKAADTRKKKVIDNTQKKLKKSVSEVDQIQKSLGAQIAEMQEKNKQLQDLTDESKESIKQAKKETSNAQAEIIQVQEAHQEDRTRMQSYFDSLQSRVLRLSDQLKTSSSSILADLIDLADSVTDKTAFNKFRDKYRDNHQKQIDSLKELVDELQEMATYYQENSKYVRDLISNAKTQMDYAQATLSNLEKQLKAAYKKIDELSAQLAESNAEKERLSDVNKGLESANKGLETELKTTQEQLKDKSTLATQPKAANTTTALSPSDNTRRTGNLFEIVVKALEKSEKNLAGTNKGKILELLRDDLQKHKENLMSDSDFKMMLKQVLGVACQHRGSDGGFAKNATTTGNFVINLIEADSLIRAVIDPNNTTKKLDFERDILRGFLGVNDKKLRQDRTTTANLRNETKGNIFHAAFITDAGSVSRPPVEAPPVVAAAAG